MNHFQSRSSLALLSLAAVCGLVGCSGLGTASFPDPGSVSPSGSGGTGVIQGQDYGGHAPLVGAHVYLVEPGSAGYGSVVKSLLTSTSPGAVKNGNWTNATSGSDQFVPAADSTGNSFYGVYTDATGNFSLSGACDAGQPVYLIGYGGTPSYIGQGTSTTPATQTNVFTASAAGTSVTSTGVGGTAQYTFTTTSTELLYIGEKVVMTGFTGSPSFNITGNVADPGVPNAAGTPVLTTTTFSVVVTGAADTLAAGTVNASSGGTVTATPANFNPAAVNVATLGVCPNNGTFDSGPSALSYILMNEVSTTAWAYAFNQFANWPQNFTAATSTGSTMVTVAGQTGFFQVGQQLSGPGIPAGTSISSIAGSTLTLSAAATATASAATLTLQTNDQHGNDEFHIGSSGTAQSMVGIANAALMAGNLYDIEGQLGNNTTVYAGEGHIARNVTLSGAGIVPRDELDTIANILAACVDSINTYRAGNGTQSTTCITLDQYAQDNGAYDISAPTHYAFNIAQAAMNIAHYPAGNGTGNTPSGTNGGAQTLTPGTAATAAAFVNALYSIPTGNVPFTPNLTSDGVGKPNDFSIGINWQTSPYALSGTRPTNVYNPSTTNAGSTTNNPAVGEVAIDSNGNAFIVNNVAPTSSVYKLAPTGYYTNIPSVAFVATGTTPIAGLAIDTSNNLWVSATVGIEILTAPNYNNQGNYPNNLDGYINGTGLGNNSNNSAEVAIDNGGFLYVANLNQLNPAVDTAGDATSQLVKEPAVAGNTATNFVVQGSGATTANTPASCANYLGYLTLDAFNNIWTSSQNNTYSPGSTVCRFSNSGTLQYSFQITPGNQTSGFAHMIAVDNGGNAWFADKNNNALYEVAAGASNTTTNGVATAFTPAALAGNAPRGIAVDGNNTIWVTNGGNASLAQFTNAGGTASPTYYVGTTANGFNYVFNKNALASAATTPSANFITFDQAGNAWVADTGHGQVIEWVGIAAPVAQPLVQQRVNSVAGNGHGIGQRP